MIRMISKHNDDATLGIAVPDFSLSVTIVGCKPPNKTHQMTIAAFGAITDTEMCMHTMDINTT